MAIDYRVISSMSNNFVESDALRQSWLIMSQREVKEVFSLDRQRRRKGTR
jgi:hypothetical protein